MTHAVVVVLGPSCPVLAKAIRPGAPLAGDAGLVLRQIPVDVQAVSDMAVPRAFRLAWIFVDATALDSPALGVCQRQLGLVAPVMIAVHHANDIEVLPPSSLQFPGGFILQPYTDASFPLLQTLITGFVTKSMAAPAP